MAEVLILVDAADGAVRKSTLELLTAARSIGEPSAVVIGKPGTAAAVKGTLAEYGAAKVYVAESDEFDDFLVAPKAEVLASVVAQASPAAVLVSSTPEHKEVAARLAFKIGSGVLTDAVTVNPDASVVQSIFGGAVTVQSKVSKGVPVITVRANSVTPSPAPGAAEQVAVPVELSDAAKAAKVVDRVVEAKGSRPALTDASVIVSGGRGVGGAENFKIIEARAEIAESERPGSSVGSQPVSSRLEALGQKRDVEHLAPVVGFGCFKEVEK